jgi:CheY-like chemotaxis protein
MAGVHVLVVDDNDLQRLVVAEALDSEGYEVTVAANGSDAVRAARARAPDILVLDLMLPDIDGATVLAQIRSDPAAAGVRVVLTTGVHSPDVRRLLRADAALYKPFGMRELIAAVEAIAPPAGS